MLEKVIEILSEFTEEPAEHINEKSNLIADLGLNSLDIINVVVAFEDAFDMEIPDEKIKDLVTVTDIVSYLETHA